MTGSEAVVTFLPGAQSAGDVYAFIPCFKVVVADETKTIWVYLTGSAEVIYRNHHVGLTDADLNRTLTLYGLNRINAYLETPGGFSALLEDPGTWTIDADTLNELDQVATKRCQYQRREAGDLLCVASAKEDKSSIGSTGTHRIAPTSRHLCGTCQLPDSRTLCSHLSHPRVAAMGAEEQVVRRHLIDALCDIGRPEIGQPARCQAGQHSCWTRHIVLTATTETAPSPLALPEAFDFLDAIWRLAFGAKKGLIALTSLSEVAGMTMQCATIDDLDARLSDLGDLIDRLTVSDELIGEADVQPGSLNRIEFVLRDRLDGESLERALQGLAIVRQVRHLRNSRQHSGAAPRFPKILAELGLAELPPKWGPLWGAIQAHTIRGLLTIRTELRRLAEAAPDPVKGT